jgi:hypothetical protein
LEHGKAIQEIAVIYFGSSVPEGFWTFLQSQPEQPRLLRARKWKWKGKSKETYVDECKEYEERRVRE